jgi:hypothetical protein
MSLSTGATAAERQAQAKLDAKTDEALKQEREQIVQRVARAEEVIREAHEQGEPVMADARLEQAQKVQRAEQQINSAAYAFLGTEYSNQDLRDVAKENGLEIEISLNDQGGRRIRYRGERKPGMAKSPGWNTTGAPGFLISGETRNINRQKSTAHENAAYQRGVDGVKAGNPGILGAISGPFLPVTRIRELTKRLTGGRSASQIGFNRYTGRNEAAPEKARIARQVYDTILAEYGARNEAGQQGLGRFGVLQQIIMSDFDVPLSALK